jgi:hypothetical protein
MSEPNPPYPVLEKIPNGLREIIATFGDCHAPDYEAKHIIEIALPYAMHFIDIHGVLHAVAHIQCHKLAAGNLLKALSAVKDRGLQKDVSEFGGGFVIRKIRGYPDLWSVHCWAAFDFNPSMYPLGSSKRFPDPVIDCFHEAGFFYGGDFKHRLDPQHWQLAVNY